MASRLARLLLALALLAGSQLALVHPLKHLDAEGSYLHLGGQLPDRKSGSPDDLCKFIAGLAACLAPAQSGLPCPGRDAASTAWRDAAFHLAAAAPPFLSQGPPLFS